MFAKVFRPFILFYFTRESSVTVTSRITPQRRSVVYVMNMYRHSSLHFADVTGCKSFCKLLALAYRCKLLQVLAAFILFHFILRV